MKWGELIMSRGQSLIEYERSKSGGRNEGETLIELLIALGIFLAMVSVVAFLLIDSYISNLQATQNSQAIFLAEEGMEAVRSIRDNDWKDLKPGSHGLAISENNWVLLGDSEDVSDILNQGKRIIKIEDIDKDRKKIISQVLWQLTPGRDYNPPTALPPEGRAPNKIELVTCLTNWQKEIKW